MKNNKNIKTLKVRAGFKEEFERALKKIDDALLSSRAHSEQGLFLHLRAIR